MTASLDGPVARQKTLPASGSSQARSKWTLLVALDREVAVVRLAKLVPGDAEEAVVDVHELAPCGVTSGG